MEKDELLKVVNNILNIGIVTGDIVNISIKIHKKDDTIITVDYDSNME